ncbi:unnamed protein product, partial [Staurois parvus]
PTIGGALCPWDTDQRKEPKTLARSCDQLCPITADRMALISALMISVAPSVPPVSAHQCHLSPVSVHINATCQCQSMHINATYQCQSMSHARHQCLPVHINATYQCPSELSISASQCRL